MKYLISFEKGEACRWLGHLDILRTFERAIRRAELPITFSTGFNPRERLAFANALSVGVTGAAELATIELTEAVDPSRIVQGLNEKLPPGIRMVSAVEIPETGSRDLLNSYDRAELLVTCACEPDTTLEAARQAADGLLSRREIVIEREREGRKKRMDIRPLIHSIEALEHNGDRITFRMILALGAEGTAKPAEIVGLMAESLSGLAVRRVHRVRLIADTIS